MRKSFFAALALLTLGSSPAFAGAMWAGQGAPTASAPVCSLNTIGGQLTGCTTVVAADSTTAPSSCTEAGTGSPTCSFTSTNGTGEFKITLASSSAATSISWTMPTATNEWTCVGWDATSTTIKLSQTTWGASTVTMTYSASPGATDVLHIMCRGG